MPVTIIAARDRLDPIHVRVDGDVRRPYWIEKGDSIRFDARERLLIENRLDDVRVLLGTHEVPTQGHHAQKPLLISRDGAQAFLNGRSL